MEGKTNNDLDAKMFRNLSRLVMILMIRRNEKKLFLWKMLKDNAEEKEKSMFAMIFFI